MADLIKIRRATAAQWESVDPILSLGEPGYDTTNNQVRFGDGVNVWTSLVAIGGEGGGGGGGTAASVTNVPNSGTGASGALGTITATNAQTAINQLDTSKLREYVLDVKRFGAVGDGVADDSVAIQAAITAAGTGSGGVPVAKIIFGPGVFRITTTLQFSRKAIILEGNGIGNLTTYGTNPGKGTTLRWAGAAGSAMLRVADSWWCDIRDIFFWPGSTDVPSEGVLFESSTEGTVGTNSRLRIQRCRFGQVAWGAASGGFQHCVRIGGASNTNNDEFSLENCEFMHATTAAVAIENTQSVWGSLSNCLFANSAIGLKANASVTGYNLTFNRNTLDIQTDSSNAVSIHGWWSERAQQHAVLTGSGGKLNVFGGKLLFDVTEWTGLLPSIDHQALGSSAMVSLNNLWLDNSTGAPHTVKGRGTASTTTGTFAVTDCIGLSTASNFDFAAVGSPTSGGVVLKVNSRDFQFMGKATGSNAITVSGNSLSFDSDIDAGATHYVRTGRAATGSLPSASTAGNAAFMYDTTTGIPVVSDGTLWTPVGSKLWRNQQTGTAYTLVIADIGKRVEMSNAAANTITVPPNGTVAFPIGTRIPVMQTGAGATTIAAGAGVTVNGYPGLRLAGQWASATLEKRGNDVWVLYGNLATTTPGAGSGSAMRTKVAGQYWPQWETVYPNSIHAGTNTLLLSFAITQDNSLGTVYWDGMYGGLSQSTFQNNIQSARAAGRCCLLSVGGEGITFTLDSATKVTNFVNSIHTLYNAWGGFDGLDWDVEGQATPTTHYVNASRALKDFYGDSFAISCSYAGDSDSLAEGTGSNPTTYKAISVQLESSGDLDMSSIQYYDYPGGPQTSDVTSRVNEMVGRGVSAAHLGIGVKIVPGSPASTLAWATGASVVSMWNTVEAAHPTIRGCNHWETIFDRGNGNEFSSVVGPAITT